MSAVLLLPQPTPRPTAAPTPTGRPTDGSAGTPPAPAAKPRTAPIRRAPADGARPSAHRRRGPSPSHRSTERRRLRNGRPNRNWWDALSRNAKAHLHVRVLLRVLAHPSCPSRWAAAGAPQRPAGAQRPGAPSRPGSPRRPGAGRPGSTLELVGKPITVMAAATVAMQAGQALDSGGAGVNRSAMPPGMRKPVAPGESCSCRSPQVLRFLHRVVLMELPSAPW